MKISVADEDLKGIVEVVRLYGPEVSNAARTSLKRNVAS